MTEIQFSRLGQLYAKVGLQTDPAIIKSRIDGAQKAYAMFDDIRLERLVRGALRLSKEEELEQVSNVLTVADPTFPVNSNDEEMGLVSSALLFEKLCESTDAANFTALAVVTSSFGGIRKFSMDADLLPEAEEKLVLAQRSKNIIPKNVAIKAKPKLEPKWKEVEAFASSNQFANATPLIKEISNALGTYSESNLRLVQKQLSQIIAHQKLLDEQMQIHWWVVGSTSIRAKKAFKDMSLFDAAINAAFDLASLTQSEFGQSAADVLISQVLPKEEKKPVKEELFKIVKRISNDQRVLQSSQMFKDEEWASLVPLHWMMALSAEANDSRDWHGRFNRTTGLRAALKILPLDFAVQLYREIVLLRIVEWEE